MFVLGYRAVQAAEYEYTTLHVVHDDYSSHCPARQCKQINLGSAAQLSRKHLYYYYCPERLYIYQIYRRRYNDPRTQQTLITTTNTIRYNPVHLEPEPRNNYIIPKPVPRSPRRDSQTNSDPNHTPYRSKDEDILDHALVQVDDSFIDDNRLVPENGGSFLYLRDQGRGIITLL